MGIFNKMFGPSGPSVKELSENNDIEGLIGKIKFGLGGCSDVCEALGKIGGERAVLALSELLDKGKDLNNRKSAISALRQIGAETVINSHIKNLEKKIEKKKYLSLKEIYKELSHIGDENVVPALKKLLEDEGTDGEVCLSIVHTLEQIGDKTAIKALTLALLDNLRGRRSSFGILEVTLRMASCFIIERIGESAIEPLIEVLEVEGNKANQFAIDMSTKDRRVANSTVANRMACGAIIGLQFLKDNRAIEPLIEALKYVGLINICSYAETALVDFGLSAVEPLTKALDNKNEKIRDNASIILKWINNKYSGNK